MSEDRPAMPAELRRRVLVEAGHRCAIPTCRQLMAVEVHHIVPWEQCQAHEYENLIALCPNCHHVAHEGHIDRKSLRLYKANLRYTHDKFSQFEVDVLFETFGLPTGVGLFFLPVMRLLIKRLLDADFVVWHANERSINQVNGLNMTPAIVEISAKGREYIESLGLHLVE